jgi:hypothetical protein
VEAKNRAEKSLEEIAIAIETIERQQQIQKLEKTD